MTIVSQNSKVVLPYGKYVLKVVNQSNLELSSIDYDDLIYPWFVIVLVGYDRIEILARYSTEDKAIAAMRNMVSSNVSKQSVFKFMKED